MTGYADRKAKKEVKRVRFKDVASQSTKKRKSIKNKEVGEIYTNDSTNKSSRRSTRSLREQESRPVSDLVMMKKANYVKRM